MGGLIGHPNVERRTICVGVDADRWNTELAACPDYANCNLTAIRNQNLAKKHEPIVTLLCQRDLNVVAGSGFELHVSATALHGLAEFRTEPVAILNRRTMHKVCTCRERCFEM